MTGSEITTIIPVYNCAPYIEEAVRSALAQRDVSNEVFVLDDGSTDDTVEVLKQFKSQIQVFALSHGGPYKARNFGASRAGGEWLAFLDADDVWELEKLREQLACAGDETAMVYTNCRNIGEYAARQSVAV